MNGIEANDHDTAEISRIKFSRGKTIMSNA